MSADAAQAARALVDAGHDIACEARSLSYAIDQRRKGEDLQASIARIRRSVTLAEKAADKIEAALDAPAEVKPEMEGVA